VSRDRWGSYLRCGNKIDVEQDHSHAYRLVPFAETSSFGVDDRDKSAFFPTTPE
jgi:hypothetical protein